MLSRLLYIPFGFGALLFLYLGQSTGNVIFNYIAIPLAICLVINFVMSPQIDWWYYERYPPKLDAGGQRFLKDRLPFYQRLNESGKQRFEQRMAMFHLAHEFIPMEVTSLPEEIQSVIAASAVQLTFGQVDYALEAFEKIVIYPSSFLSPRYPRHMHSSEIHAEDGGLIFSGRHLMHGFVEPKKYYHSALHECVQAWIHINPNRKYPVLGEDIWKTLEEISHFSPASMQEWIGLPDIDPMAVSLCHFFVFSEQFQAVALQLYKEISELLNINPMEGEQPILYINQ